VLGALFGLAMIITYRLVIGIDPAVVHLVSRNSADFRSIIDLVGAREVSRHGKFGS